MDIVAGRTLEARFQAVRQRISTGKESTKRPVVTAGKRREA
jgi:hypothetical protein